MKSSKANTDAANACLTQWSSCRDTCQAYASTYSESDNQNLFLLNAQACGGLSSKSDALTAAGTSSLDLSDSGLNCLTNSSQSPQSLGEGSSDAHKNSAASTSTAACAANPTAPGCEQAQHQYDAAKAGTAGFGEVDTSKGSFDVGDTSGLNVTAPVVGGAEGTPGAPMKNGTVANNTGGGIPGGGGGGGAKGGSAPAAQGGLGGVLSNIADIEKGLLGGGYSEILHGKNPWSDEPPDEESVQRALATLRGTTYVAPSMDLKRYLPGGDLAKQGGLLPPTSTEFHGRGVDLFSRIHDRYEEKCRLGELLDCH